MKNYKKYIFDLDYTLLIPDWSKEDDFFKKTIPLEEQEEFFKQKQSILNKYELEFPKYDFKTLSDFFKSYGFHVSEEVIDGWMIHNGETIKDEIADGVPELFEYLKQNNKEIVILTSWFSGTQIPRLKRTGLYDYIDKIVAGEDAMKPDLESFELAIGNTSKEDCIMIGDSIKSDKLGAENAGIDCYIIDKNHSIRDLLLMIKNSNRKIICTNDINNKGEKNMDSERILKEKLDNLNGQIDVIKKEKQQLDRKLRDINMEKELLCHSISKCSVFNETILFFIAKLLSTKEKEPFRVFEYKRYREVSVYPRTLEENTYIGIASEDNIKNNGNNLDRFFAKNLGYEIYEKNWRIIEPNKDCYDKITGYYDLNDLQENIRSITFPFLLNKYDITNSYCGRYARTNFDEYHYVQDFITYLFNLQIQKNGESLTYEEMSNAYEDFLALEKTKTKTKTKKR